MSYGMKTFYNGASFGRSEIPMPEGDAFFQGILDAITAGWRVCSYFGVPNAAGATLYCTREPCTGCRRLIAGAGITKVLWGSPGLPGA